METTTEETPGENKKKWVMTEARRLAIQRNLSKGRKKRVKIKKEVEGTAVNRQRRKRLPKVVEIPLAPAEDYDLLAAIIVAVYGKLRGPR